MANILTLNLVVSSATKALTFYEKVFDGVRLDVYEFTEAIANNEANVRVGNVDLRLIDENAAFECFPPKQGEVDSIWLQMEVEDVEVTLKKAIDNGAKVTQEPDVFMGTKHAEIVDPFGYTWTINQVIEVISFEERYETYKNMISE
ncbi:VOC family protein [Aerococcaceae bacterium DSM 111021]|nr:VOC family protein [Aerococcaceae bacterium DSM 111021]